MLQSGLDITAVITHRFPAKYLAQVFEVVPSGHCRKSSLTGPPELNARRGGLSAAPLTFG